MGTVTAMWQFALIPLLTANAAEPPAVAEKGMACLAAELPDEVRHALTVPQETPWFSLLPQAFTPAPKFEPRPWHFGIASPSSRNPDLLIHSGCGPMARPGVPLDEQGRIDLRVLNPALADSLEAERPTRRAEISGSQVMVPAIAERRPDDATDHFRLALAITTGSDWLRSTARAPLETSSGVNLFDAPEPVDLSRLLAENSGSDHDGISPTAVVPDGIVIQNCAGPSSAERLPSNQSASPGDAPTH
jgi:hypothetical protein